jgi:methyl-accepting chemotaxis protein
MYASASLKTKVLITIILINAVSIISFAGYTYHVRKASIFQNVDDRLRAGASAVPYLLPRDLQDRLTLDASEHLKNVMLLSRYAGELKLTYIYTMVKNGDKVFITSSSATNQELKEASYDTFMTEYEDASPALKQAFIDKLPYFEDTNDKYGHFRSLLLPMRSASGRVYIAGADLDISYIRALLMESLMQSLILGIVVFCLSMVVTILVLRKFTSSITHMLQHMGGIITSGDLTARIPIRSSDEIGMIAIKFNEFLDVMHQIISEVTDMTHSIFRASQNLAVGSEALATRTGEQSQAIDDTGQTLHDISDFIQRSHTDVAAVEANLQVFKDSILSRVTLIRDVTETMQAIDASSMEIGKIVEVINEINFRTNLLALNASIEAARAGEAGKGFAVVATEVRNLAQETVTSSQTIEQITMHSRESTRKGMDLVSATSTFFEGVVANIADIVRNIAAITLRFNEQASGVQHISGMITHSEKIMHSNTELAQMLSATGHELKTSVEGLEKLVREFQI